MAPRNPVRPSGAFPRAQPILWQTPGLFEGYGINTKASIKSKSAAVFANIDWEVVKGLHVLPGIRFNYDEKDVVYDRKTYGGLDTPTQPCSP